MSSSHGTPQRQLGLLQTTSLVTGNLVGSGVFLLPAALAIYGNLTLIAWLLTGLGALMLAWLFAKMSLLNPQNGGPHQFVTEAFGKPCGYWVAWGYWMLSWISNAALIVAAVSYFGVLFGPFSPVQVLLIELGILVTITSINIIGIQAAGKFEFVMTTLKLIPLVGIPLVGLFYLDWTALSFSLPQEITVGSGIKAAMFLTIWGFVGLETATVAGGEIKNPRQTIPFATLFGTGLALAVYLLGCFVMLNLLGQQVLMKSQAPYADLAGTMFGGNWAPWIALAAVICCLGSFNGWTMVVGRIAQGAANQDLFPPIFAKTNRQGTPYMSILISACCTLPMLFLSLKSDLMGQFNFIIDVSITLILIVYLFGTFAYLKLYQGQHTFKQQLMALGAFLFVCICLWAAGIKMLALSLVLLLLGFPMFLVRQRKLKTSNTTKPIVAV